jgi:hypothetical protein
VYSGHSLKPLIINFYRIFMGIFKVNAFKIVVFNFFLNNFFLKIESLKSALGGAVVSKTLNLF